MNKDTCTEERFLSDIKTHEMTVIRDEGLHRHLRFKRPESITMYFDLITWPGHLCLTGDMGTYVFSRIEDMFEFFRTDDTYAKSHPERKLFINTGYWGEKLLSISRSGGYREFSSDKFEAAVKSDFEESKFESENQKESVWNDIENSVLCYVHDSEYASMQAAIDYKSDYGHSFYDFWEHSFKEYTFHYIWCLYAIVWGIGVYDEEMK